MMLALTIWQPWGSLIIAGAKPYEFGGWRTSRSIIGQRVVIHAAARKVDWREVHQLVRLLEAGGRYAAKTCLHPSLGLELLRSGMATPATLPIGAGLGTAIIGEPRNGLEIAEEFGVPRANDSDRDEHANWGWPMLEIERWAEPIPMRGAQGFWPWPTVEAAGLG